MFRQLDVLGRAFMAALVTSNVRPFSIMKRSHHTNHMLLVVALMSFANVSVEGQSGPPRYKTSTSCLTEVRGGRKSCWGVVINLEDGRFKKTIRKNELKVFEAKHGRNITSLMTWRTACDGKQLTIKFKPGTGDFGTGNRAEITLYKTAFALTPKDLSNSTIIVQNIDIK